MLLCATTEFSPRFQAMRLSLTHGSRTIRGCLLLILPVAAFATTRAAEPLEYNRDIRPILADNCFACHGADSAARKGDLRLDQREAAIEMGAIAPNDAANSELLNRLVTDDPDLVMPPPETKKTLTAEQKQLLKQWIETGA
ncbi:MAG: hypothetical protein KDA58_16355, partial [Planctomycetaceae bacterium]|nr:hypothetical protein [Planctomycetaceae bacterium]